MAKEFTYEIVKELEVLVEDPRDNGWDLVANYIKWGNSEKPVLDIRKWNKDRTRMSKGISLTGDGVHALYHLLQDNLDDIYKRLG